MAELTSGKAEVCGLHATGETRLPTAVIEFAGTDGAPRGLPVVTAGRSFGLSGARSAGVDGADVVAYVWTLLPE